MSDERVSMSTYLVGKGSSSSVYRGSHKGKIVVVKKVTSESSSCFLSFLRELRIVCALPEHPNLSLPTHFNRFLFVCPEALGSLEEANRFPHLLVNLTVGRVAAHLTAGLSFIHKLGYLHNDIKPGNIHVFLCESSSPDTQLSFALGDWGISTKIDGHYNDTTPHYKSPSYLATEIPSKETDFWALGKVLYQLATGSGCLCLGYLEAFEKNPTIQSRIVEESCKAACSVSPLVGEEWFVQDVRRMLLETPGDYEDRTGNHACEILPRKDLSKGVMFEFSQWIDVYPLSNQTDVPYDLDEDVFDLCGVILSKWDAHICSSVEWYVQKFLLYKKYGKSGCLDTEEQKKEIMDVLLILDVGSLYFYYEYIERLLPDWREKKEAVLEFIDLVHSI